MNAAESFDYEKFKTLSGLDVCHYMEPFVNVPTTNVSEEVLDRMLSELPTYDEYHLVYALEFGAKNSPSTFAPQLPRYLEREPDSVWCAAFNSLDQLPSNCVTKDVVDSVRAIQTSRKVGSAIKELLGRLEKRFSERQALGAS